MLAQVETEVLQKGGAYAFMDTDSIAIVSTEKGGIVNCPGGKERTPEGLGAIRALSWREVEDIRRRFARLNPYNPKVVGRSILKLEMENYQ